jgi:nitric oxide reductase NorD protein
MAEPEELILEGAHFATRVARDVWRRYGTSVPETTIPLASVRVRLEMFLSALFRTPVPVVRMEPPAPASWLSRLARGRAHHRGDELLSSGTDGRHVCLPPVLPVTAGGQDALGLYRLLAVEQAARLVRRTPQVFAGIESSGIEDWFLLAEAAAIDCWIAAEVPGLVPALAAARARALERPVGRHHSTPDATLEREVRALLAAHPLTPPFRPGDDDSVEDSLAWARRQSQRDAGRRQRRLVLPWYWGRVLAVSQPLGFLPQQTTVDGEAPRQARQSRVSEMRRRPRAREAAEDEDDSSSGTWVIRADEPQESVEDPYGLQRPTDRDDAADPEGLADSLSELPEARMVRTPGQAREVLRSGEEIERGEGPARAPARARGLVYPEWDYRTTAYHQQGAIVREPPAPLGDAAWVTMAMARHARLARRVRARFERLRPRHVSLNRQPDGSEPDIAAWVSTCADMRAGATVDGRLYVERRPSRRELTVALLADVSASTDGWVSSNRRIVDVEKEALLVVCEALDALGDRYGIFAFSGEGADDVSVLTLKSFAEARSPTVERRIAALDSDRYTRMGASIRHVTAALGRERTSRRLLLILSDGKPNDVDVYEGRYGVEDTRQAVAEAKRQGVTVFCLTVDREAPRYASRIFGPAGFAVLHQADQLPVVLIDMLRQLVRC